MNLLIILFSVWMILSYFEPFTQAQGKFKVTSVTYIKELQNDGHIPNLQKNIFIDTEEKRLELCRGGLKKVKNDNRRFWSSKGKDVNLMKEFSVGELKVHVFTEVGDFRISAKTAYKCSTEPEIYIRNDIQKSYDDQPIFQVMIYKEDLPRPILKEINLYQLFRLTDIVEAYPRDILLMSKSIMGVPTRIPYFDTDNLSEEQRLELCSKGAQLSSKLNVELLKDTKTSKNKFYKTTTFGRFFKDDEQIIEAFECPTQPKIYISMQDEFMTWVMIKILDGHRATMAGEKLKPISDEGTTAEDLYHRVKNAIPRTNTKTDQIIDSRVQYEICRQIFKISFAKGKDAIIPRINEAQIFPTYDMRTYKELKTKDPTLCSRFYEDDDSKIVPDGKDIIIVNGPESTNVMVSKSQKNLPEDVFPCLIRFNPGDYEVYYFSKEYNVNTSNDSSGYIAGRFVFKRSPSNDSTIIPALAMIQPGAKFIETPNVELLYLERRKAQDLAEKDSDDPLCKLNNLERSKICTLVFHTVFHTLITPLYELGCARNPITFMTKDGKEEATGNQYYEWMLPCHECPRYDDNPMKIYYLSQAYNKSNPSSSNDVFAYSRAFQSSKVILEKAYTDPRIGDLLKMK